MHQFRKTSYHYFRLVTQSRLKTLVKMKKKGLKMHRKLFAQLFIAAQVGGGDVQKLFQHETTREPPSLLKESEIRSGNKADLLPYLKDDLLKPNNSNTFTDYAEDIFSAAVRKEITKFD